MRRGILPTWAGRASGIALLLALASLPTVLPAWAGPARLYLALSDERTGRALYCVPVDPGQEFVIEFMHSYDRFPFREVYRLQGAGEIRLLRMVFRSVLNGQGFVYPGMRVRADGWGEIDDIPVVTGQVEFIMGSEEHANHRLIVGGQVHRLSRIVEAGTVVVIRARGTPCEETRASTGEQ